MTFWDETNWFAVQAKPYREGLAAASVSRLDLEVVFPRIRLEQLVAGIWRMVAKPLFPGYIFARFCPVVSCEALACARGVLRIVGAGSSPIPLEQAIVEEIKERVHPDGFVHLDRPPFVSGDRVRIDQGPLSGWMGEVEREWDDGRRVMILLEAMQDARLLVERRWLSLPLA